MNTLTKVFVVLLVIFSIAFTMMTVQFSANVPDWRSQATSWKTRAQMIDTYNRNLIAGKVAEAAQAAKDRQAWEEQKAGLQAQLQEAQVQLQDAKQRLAKAEAEASSMDATVKKLTAELGIAHTVAAKARDHREELEKRNIELEKRMLDLTEANNERIATIIVLEQQTRQQEQEINILKEQSRKMQKKLRIREAGLEESTVTIPTDKVTALSAAQVSPLRGQITAVTGNFASISVGSNDGVEAGMTFIIYDESGYLGDLEITEVAPDSAAGDLRNINGQISSRDMVVEESGYIAMNR